MAQVEASTMSVVHKICCGLDVHKDIIVACLSYCDEQGNQKEIIREFGGLTSQLYLLRNWLLEFNCPIVAMESTGVYWRPVHNVLEGKMEILLVNARHYKNVPGRKTDIGDSKWLCNLLRHGLLRGSYIPPEHIRQWRELTRYRRQLVKEISNFKRRVHKVFQTANIKIDSVVTDLFGATGRNLIEYLCSEKKITIEGVANRTRGSLRKKSVELFEALDGFFQDHHRFMICSLLSIIAALEEEARSISKRTAELMSSQNSLLDRMEEIPGISTTSAQAILGELGTDLKAFDSPEALSAWAGVAPGNNESAGKRHSGKSPVRKHSLKEILVEVAWAAIKKKESYYKAKFHRLKSRRGAKRAIVAIAHRILKALFYIIKHGESYRELGEAHFARINQAFKIKKLQLQAKNLGFELVSVK